MGGTRSDLVAVLFRVYGRNDCGMNQIVLLFFVLLRFGGSQWLRSTYWQIEVSTRVL